MEEAIGVLVGVTFDVVVKFLKDDADPVEVNLGFVVAGLHPVEDRAVGEFVKCEHLDVDELVQQVEDHLPHLLGELLSPCQESEGEVEDYGKLRVS